MTITLPAITATRTDGGDPGRRNQEVPDAGDVPTVAAARDPGIAFGRDALTSAGAVGTALSTTAEKVSEGLFKEADRQKKLEDATQTTDAQMAFEADGMQEFNRRQTEGDPSSPTFMSDYQDYLNQKTQDVLGPLQGKVSPEAYEKVRESMLKSSQAMADAAGRVQLDATEKKAQNQIDTRINTWSAQASCDPGFLDTFLGMADEGLGDYSGALRPDQEAAARAKARSSIIVNAFSGMVDQKNFKGAQGVLDNEAYNDDIPAATRRAMMTTLDNGQKSAQSEARANIRMRLDDEIASIRETGSGIGVTPAEINAAYGDQAPRILKQIDDEKAFYQTKSQVALNTPAEDAAAIQNLQPSGEGFKAEAERRDLYVKAVVQKYKAISDDPVSYVMSASPDIRQAYADSANDPTQLRRAVAMSEAMQERLGVPTYQQRALSNEQAKNMVASITKTSPELAADTIQTLANSYGDSLWPQVYHDLVRAKLPPAYSVLATTDDAVARKSLAEALKNEAADPGALKRGLAKEDAQSIDEDVSNELQPLRSSLASLPNGAELADRYAKAASLLAYKYAATSSPTDAAKRAVSDLVGEKYDFVQQGAFNARAPHGQTRPVVDTALRTMGALTADDMPDPIDNPNLRPEARKEMELLSSDRRKAIALSGAQRGTWVTNEGDDGWLLLDVNQQPVVRKDGSRVEFKFKDASPSPVDLSSQYMGVGP